MTDRKDEVLIAEKEAKAKIAQVMQEKDDLLKQAKDKAKKDLKSHDDEMRGKTQEKITQLILNRGEIDVIEEKTKSELKTLQTSFEKNKGKVVDFLFNSVTTVKIHIPDVVKGNFEETYK
jgi:vacuolar-type H+-ATPase subunit H